MGLAGKAERASQRERTVTVSADHSTLTLALMSDGTAISKVPAEDSGANRVSDTFDVSAKRRYAALISQMKKQVKTVADGQKGAHRRRNRALLAFVGRWPTRR